MLSVVSLITGSVALTVIGCAALQDVRERLIDNRFSLMLLVLAAIHHVSIADGPLQWLAISGGAGCVAATLLLAGYALWRAGGLGGGDVKLLVAAAFFVGVEGVATLLVGTVLAGGVLALVLLIWPVALRQLPPMLPLSMMPPAAAQLVSGAAGTPRSIPYGVAIATGAALAIVPSLPPVIG